VEGEEVMEKGKGGEGKFASSYFWGDRL